MMMMIRKIHRARIYIYISIMQQHAHCALRIGRIFFSRVNFLCQLFFGVCSTPVLPQWHVKEPSHSAKSAGGRYT